MCTKVWKNEFRYQQTSRGVFISIFYLHTTHRKFIIASLALNKLPIEIKKHIKSFMQLTETKCYLG